MATLIFVIAAIIGVTRLIPHPSQKIVAAWFDDSWSYRQAINISSHSTAESDVYIIATINIGTTIKAQANDGDFRFTDSNGQLLAYYISADKGSTAPTFHIQLTSFPAGAQTVYAYYGNPTAINGAEATGFSTQASSYTIGSYNGEEANTPPIAYWKFDEGVGSTSNDSSASNNPLSLISSNWQPENFCISSKCVSFPKSSNAYLSASDSPSLSPTVSISISIWVKPVNTGSTLALVVKNNSYRMVTDSSGNLTCQFHNGTSWQTAVSSSTPLALNQWQHLSCVYNGGDIYIYQDALQTRFYSPPISYGIGDTTSALEIGRDVSGTYQPFTGYIDEVKIYSYGRSAAQTKSDYLSRGSVKGVTTNLGSNIDNLSSNSLVAYFPLNENSGTTIADISSIGFTGLFGTGSSAPAWVNAKFGTGTSFSGNDYISIGTTLSSVNTISFWLYPSSTTNSFLTFNSSSYLNSSSGTISAVGLTSPIVYVNGAIGATLVVNTWQHITVTTTSSINADQITIGQANSSYLTGTLDDLRFYSSVLSPRQVRDLYNWAPGPILNWKFEEGTGTTAYDSSTYNNTGTFTGSPSRVIGKNGHALSFEGVSSYILSTETVSTQLTTGTAEAWIKTSNPGSSYRGIVTKQLAYGMFLQDNEFGIYDWGGSAWRGSGRNLNDGSWHHVAFSFQSGITNGTTLYIDGVAVKTVTMTVNSQGVPVVAAAGSNSATQNFGGLIDEVKIYNYLRSAKQIAADLNNNHPAGGSPIASMPFHWKFDEGINTTTNNSGFYGTSLNGTMSGSGSSLPVWTSHGKYGNALIFNGDNVTVSTGTTGLDTAAGGYNTVSFWMNWNGATGATPINFGSPYYDLIIYDSSCFGFNTGNGDCYGISPTTLSNTWVHVTGVFYNGSYLNNSLYINGIRQTLSQLSGSAQSGTVGSTVYVGLLTPGTGFNFKGTLDDIKIYNYAISSDDVLLDYNRGSATVLGSYSTNTGNTAPSSATSQEYCQPGASDTCTSPIGEWKIDEKSGTTIRDVLGNGYTGTFGTGTSAPTWESSIVGSNQKFFSNAANLKFDGNDYVTLGDINAYEFGASDRFTISGWVKTNSLTDADIFGRTNGTWTVANWTWNLYQYGAGNFAFGLGDGSSFDLQSSFYSGVATNTWYFLTIVVGAQNESIDFYVNGQLQSAKSITRTRGQLRQTSSEFRIGGDANYYNGNIDQIRFYNYARTPAQISLDYNRGAPLGHWKLDECQGSLAHNSMGVGNTGQITIGASGTQIALGTCSVGGTSAWSNGSSGKYNASLNFDGTDDYVNVNSSSNITFPTSVTVSAWIKTSSVAQRPVVSNRSGGGGNTYFGIQTNKVFLYHNPATPPDVSSSTSISDNIWHHIVYTHGGSSTKIYIDGNLDIATTQTGYVATTDSIKIAYDVTNGEYFPGQIDDVRVYGYDLTAAQIKTLYNQNSVLRFGPSSGSP